MGSGYGRGLGAAGFQGVFAAGHGCWMCGEETEFQCRGMGQLQMFFFSQCFKSSDGKIMAILIRHLHCALIFRREKNHILNVQM